MKKFRISKKAATALITGVVVVFNDKLGLHLDNGQIVGFVAIAIGYIYGQAQVDQTLIHKGLKYK